MLIDSAKTSTLEGAATTVYATGGRGNARLITWEGEKTLTFTVEDALLSPIGFSILSGANLFDYDNQPVHVNRVIRSGLTFSASNTTYTALYEKNTAGTAYVAFSGIDTEEIAAIVAYYGNDAQLWVPANHNDVADPTTATESEITNGPKYYYTATTSPSNDECTINLSNNLQSPICKDAPLFVSIIKDDCVTGDFLKVTSVDDKTITVSNAIKRYDATGALETTGETITSNNAGQYVVLVDCYTLESNEAKAMELQINAEDFAGYFYVEADTLVRRQSDGKDLPAILTIPLVKIQSNFSITMASSGDPSTFTFTMDAMPGYTYFNNKKKVLCTFQVIDESASAVKRDAVMRHNTGTQNNYVHTGFYPEGNLNFANDIKDYEV